MSEDRVPEPAPANGDRQTPGPPADSVSSAIPPKCPTRTRMYQQGGLAEEGFPGYEMPFWTGLFVRKGTPPEAIARLNAALVESLNDPAVIKRITELGQELPAPDQRTPEALGARHRADIEKWWPLVKAANIKAE